MADACAGESNRENARKDSNSIFPLSTERKCEEIDTEHVALLLHAGGMCYSSSPVSFCSRMLALYFFSFSLFCSNVQCGAEFCCFT